MPSGAAGVSCWLTYDNRPFLGQGASTRPGNEIVTPGGDWILEWDGDGSVHLGRRATSLTATQTDVVLKSGSDSTRTKTYTVAAGTELMVTITSIGSSYPKNIRVWYPGQKDKVFNTAFLDTLKKSDGTSQFQVLRFMDWNRTNRSTAANWPADRTRVSSRSYSARAESPGGVPYEVMIDLCNELNAHLWITVPERATDDYVTKLANLVRYGDERGSANTNNARRLEDGLHVYLEYTNEVWNGGFTAAGWITDNITAPSVGSDVFQKYGHRARQIWNIFENIMGDSRTVNVLGAQTGNSGVVSKMLEGAEDTLTPRTATHAEAMGLTFYFGHEYAHTIYANGWHNTTGTARATALTDSFTALQTILDTTLNNIFGGQYTDRGVANTWGLSLVAYEGNSHVDARNDDHRNNANMNNFIWDLHEDPRMAALITQALNRFDSEGVRAICGFVDHGRWSQWGCWGYRRKLGQTLPIWDAYVAWLNGSSTTTNQAPTVSLTSDVTSGNAPLTVNFTATASDPEGSSLSYEWNVDDGLGFVSGAATRSVTFSSADTYTVQVRVSDGSLTATAQRDITVSAGDTGATTSSADSVAANLTASATSFGSGLTALNYNGGNGFSGRNQTATTLAAAITGNDYLAFTLTPASGKDVSVTALKLRPLSQNRERTFAVFSSVGGFAAGNVIGTFTHNGGSNAAEVTVPITGVSNRTSAVEFRIYVYGGTDQWESVGLGGSTGNDLVVVGTVGGGTVNQPPVASLTATPSSGAAPLTVTLNASGSTDPEGATLTYEWNFDDGAGFVAGDATESVTLPLASTYTIQVRVSDGSLTDTESISITPTGAEVSLAVWDFSGTNGAATSAVDSVATSVTASATSFGSGLTATNYSGGGGFSATKQTATTLAAAITGNDYISFTLTPASGKGLNVTSLRLRPSSQNQERTFAVFSSVGGFADGSQIATFTHNGGINATERTVTITGVNNRTTAVEFRIYIYGGTNQWEAVGLGSSTGDDLTVRGSVQ
jgi:PKD repeat protein